jgi:prepilin-type N-terminal cleavage/methylation domain-containing protein
MAKIETSNPRGFTLIELLVTMVVLIVGMAIGIPAFSSMMTKNRLDSAAQNMKSAYGFALSESFKSRSKIGVCGVASSTSTSCIEDDYVKEHQWNGGWMVFSGEIDSPVPIRYWEPTTGVTYSAEETGQFDAAGTLINEENEIQIRESDQIVCAHVSIAGQVSLSGYQDVDDGNCF